MTALTLLLPFEELMEAIELHLVDKGFIKDDEFLMYADLGLEVNDKGFVTLDLEIEKLDDAAIRETESDD